MRFRAGLLGPGESGLGLTEGAARKQVALQGTSTQHSEDYLMRHHEPDLPLVSVLLAAVGTL